MDDILHTLVVDDEERIRYFLKETLERAGHKVVPASSGEEALDRLKDSAFDLAILDLKLGGFVDGQQVLEAIRWQYPSTFVIILTAHGSLESAVDAIRESVDGYLLKPVRPEEIRRTVDRLFQRRTKLAETQGQMEKVLARGPFRVDLARYEVTRDGELLDLSPGDIKLLVHLMRQYPQVIGPKELVMIVRDFEPEYVQEAREIIKWYIHRLRQQVEPDPRNPRYILNVRGIGYRFSG